MQSILQYCTFPDILFVAYSSLYRIKSGQENSSTNLFEYGYLARAR